MGFVKLGKLLNKSIKRAQIEDKVEASLVMEEFLRQSKKVFGAKSSQKIKPLYLKNQVLKISVISSVLSQEIKLNEKTLIQMINKKLKKRLVRKISSTL